MTFWCLRQEKLSKDSLSVFRLLSLGGVFWVVCERDWTIDGDQVGCKGEIDIGTIGVPRRGTKLLCR